MIMMTPEQRALMEYLMKRSTSQGIAAEASLTLEQGFHVEVRGGDVDTLEHQRGQGLALSLYKDHRVAHVDASQLTGVAADLLFDKALSMLSYAEADPCSGLAPKSLMIDALSDLELCDGVEPNPTDVIANAIDCEKQALHLHSAVDQVEAVCASHFICQHAYANTHGVYASYPTSMHSMHCSVIAKSSDGGMERDSEYTRSRHFDALKNTEWLAQASVNNTVSRLGAKQIKTGNYPVVFDAPVAKSIIDHFLSANSGGRLYQNASFLCEALGDTLFPPYVTIRQLPNLPKAIGSVQFDDDGVRTKAQDYVTSGVLQQHVLSHYSANRLGMVTTGNAGGVFNCIVDMPTQSKKDLLLKMGTGILVTELMGQGINLVTGDYSRGAFGYWVENGEIQYPVHEFTVASTLQKMFKGIVAMADDVDTRGNIRTGSILIDQMQVAA